MAPRECRTRPLLSIFLFLISMNRSVLLLPCVMGTALACFLRGPGPPERTGSSFSLCLGGLTGPGGACSVELAGYKAPLERGGGGSRPLSPACAQLREVTKPVRPPACSRLASPRGLQTGPALRLRSGLAAGCLGDAGSHAGGTWEVHRSRNGDRGRKRAAELKRTVARVRRGVRGSWEWKSGRQSRGRACAVPHVPTPRGRAPPSWSPVRSHRATRWPRAHGVRRRCSG